MDERLSASGAELAPVDGASVRDVARQIADGGFEAVAVCLLHAYADGAHERQVGELLRQTLDVPVVLGQDLARTYGPSHVISEILTVPMTSPDPALLERLMRDDPEGAGAVYAGCTFCTGPQLDAFRVALGVPVIDPGQPAVLLAVAAARARQGVRSASHALDV